MALDPLGHMRIAVSDFEKSREFYGAFFAQMGFKQVSEKGWVTPEGLGIWIIQAAHPDHRYVFEAPGLHHLCLKAQSRGEVDRMHRFLVEHHMPIVAAPQAYPQYTPDYYAVFFSDPDGIELEVAYY
ncbi:MAG: VOC family protein [Candidatus Sungbacteria bacterium]|nr:VOC family protein [Candidatus Sungbacteria bacterium]